MTVYVDDLHQYPDKAYSRWCHMWADTREELLRMADVIGLNRKWLQDMPHHVINPHFDVTASKRSLAIQNGAVYMKSSDWIKAHKSATAEQPKETTP